MTSSRPMAGARLLEVQEPIIPLVQAWVREHPGTISLGQGVVSYGPPGQALETLKTFGLDPSDHLYGPVGGNPLLIERLKEKVLRENGIHMGDSRRIMVTAGSNMAFFEIIQAITAPGDEVLLPLPFYFNQEMAIRMLGCVPVPVPTRPNYQLDLVALAQAVTPRTRAIVTVSPNNPTGQVYPESDLRRVSDLCRERGLYHLSDEAYEYFAWEDHRHFSPGSIPESDPYTVSFFSLSKTFGFAGWRIGYMVIPETLAPILNKIQDTNLICAPRPSQAAALACLEVGRSYFEGHAETLIGLRKEVLMRLEALGSLIEQPPEASGAFYVFLKIRTGLSGLGVAERLARKFGVAVIPGEAFGMRDGCYLRVAYGAPDSASVIEGVTRLVTGIRAICEGP